MLILSSIIWHKKRKCAKYFLNLKALKLKCIAAQLHVYVGLFGANCAITVIIALLNSALQIQSLNNVIFAGSEWLQISNIDSSCFAKRVILRGRDYVFTIRTLIVIR